MSKQALLGDAWIREAQEASRLIEEIESRIKDQNPGQSVSDNARRKLLELGPKLDRLESLLHNPAAKPILTNQDLDLRRNMLSELQLRTREMALSLYRLQVASSPGSLPAKDIEEPAESISSYSQDDTKINISKQEHELLVSFVVKTRNHFPWLEKMDLESLPGHLPGVGICCTSVRFGYCLRSYLTYLNYWTLEVLSFIFMEQHFFNTFSGECQMVKQKNELTHHYMCLPFAAGAREPTYEELYSFWLPWMDMRIRIFIRRLQSSCYITLAYWPWMLINLDY
ncbi:hypothetical protein NE237_012229 [Protea cynaroides]|uniref:Uncharacterized protein n=1 Tax=Protea cynaroides TaxID=273540 RepID=A0A9Q0GWE4_9MAGN|nr:hypothetical protein NE237_012229 [Protea cynaroides]